jgi:tetratricopeptide (TPR) repeat protein
MTRADDTGDGAPPPRSPRRVGRRRRRLRRTIAILAALGVSGIVIGTGIYWVKRPRPYRPGEDLPAITRRLAHDLPEGAPQFRFVDVTVESGLQPFVSFHGDRSSQLPEDMGSGAAWGDFDNDGDDDVFLVSAGAALGAAPETRAPCVLFENRGDGTFRAVPDFPTLRLHGMGAAWGDCDDDGWLDLIVTGYDSLVLLRNEEGRLVRDTGFPSPPGFWAGATWGDFDNDRRLDLYVCGYVRYEESAADAAAVSRHSGWVVPYTLNPSSYAPERNLLFHNQGDGTFHEVAESLGVANPEGRSLEAIWHDLDQDGWLDLYVANDVSDNAFYRNAGGRFEDVSHAAWVADYRGSMGLAVGDYDRDGDDDLFITHWVAQENALYTSLLRDMRSLADDEPDDPGDPGDPDRALDAAPVRFGDDGSARGLGQISIQRVGWGTEFADFDADGWLDLAVANGSTFETDDQPKGLQPQRSFLFWNREGRYFHDLAGFSEPFQAPRVSRGLAVSDYDQDGDLDILLVDHDGGARLLRNETRAGSWIQIRLRSLTPSEAPIGFADGAIIEAEVPGATLRRAVGSASYLSQSSRTIHIGLGAATRVDRLAIHWIGGGTDVHTDLAANALWEIREGDPAATMVRRDPGGDGRARATGSPRDDRAERERVVTFWSKQRAGMTAMKVDGDLTAAIALFEEALALEPEHEDTRYYLANCLASVGKPEAAIGELEELIRINPRSHRALKRLGVILATRADAPGALREASAVLERALAINPEETGVLMALAEVAVMLGNRDQARQRLEWVTRTNPRAVGALYLSGYLAWKEGDEERAREHLRRAAESRGEDWTPTGMTAEGDVGRRMHSDLTPLSRFWQSWDGSLEPGDAYRGLDVYMQRHRPE